MWSGIDVKQYMYTNWCVNYGLGAMTEFGYTFLGLASAGTCDVLCTAKPGGLRVDLARSSRSTAVLLSSTAVHVVSSVKVVYCI